MKILLSWSSGKDSAWALQLLHQLHPGSVSALLTTFNEHYNRVSIHGVRMSLVEEQAKAIGLPLWTLAIPNACEEQLYSNKLKEVYFSAVEQGFTHVAFGDIHLEHVRLAREESLKNLPLKPLFPLWGQVHLHHEMIQGGLKTLIAAIDSTKLHSRFLGCAFDHSLLNALPEEVDPCGEKGEFHTFVTDGPMFKNGIKVKTGKIYEKHPFAFIDLESVF